MTGRTQLGQFHNRIFSICSPRKNRSVISSSILSSLSFRLQRLKGARHFSFIKNCVFKEIQPSHVTLAFREEASFYYFLVSLIPPRKFGFCSSSLFTAPHIPDKQTLDFEGYYLLTFNKRSVFCFHLTSCLFGA
jgi:hypothetical protein